MPFIRRSHIPGSVQHLIARTVGGEFRISGAIERVAYLKRAEKAAARCDCVPLAFAIMSNHVHWVVMAGGDPVSGFIHSLHTSYARWLNLRQARFGPVFSARFSSIVFTRHNALPLLAYVHNNPVRAGIVRRADETTWTSHRFYVTPSSAPAWLDVRQGLALSGCSSSDEFQRAVHAAANEPKNLIWTSRDVAKARVQVRNGVGRAVEIGGPIVDSAGTYHEIFARPSATIFVRREVTIEQVLALVAHQTKLNQRAILSRDRHRDIVSARRLALGVWRHCGGTQAEMAAALGISQSAASMLNSPASQLSLQSTADAVIAMLDELSGQSSVVKIR